MNDDEDEKLWLEACKNKMLIGRLEACKLELRATICTACMDVLASFRRGGNVENMWESIKCTIEEADSKIGLIRRARLSCELQLRSLESIGELWQSCELQSR